MQNEYQESLLLKTVRGGGRDRIKEQHIMRQRQRGKKKQREGEREEERENERERKCEELK